MSRTKSITDLITDLQKENESLKKLEKIANQYTRMEFGYSVKDLHDMLFKLERYERKAQERDASRQGQQSSNEHSE